MDTASEADSGIPSSQSDEGLVLLRVSVPELNIQKCLQFHRDELVWDVKQQCLAALPKELKESFNYGLFCPPQNGKAGKFLDEERPLGDYPFPDPVGYLELKYKRRVYKMMNLDEKQIKNMHSKANLKKFMEMVTNAQAEKITKMCAKGLDPNFHWNDTGETPLTIAVTQKKCSRVILSLVNGGALLDYRTRDGSTSMHRAVEKNNFEAVKTLLDLGASPSYRDLKGLTPLYYSIIHNTDPIVCETLLHDHAAIGAQDLQGWQEVHQCCRNALVQHLEHLLYYGADMNSRNASGNTPLHVCAVNNQESCARVLLFRGADKEALNFANQTPYQVAVIAQNFELAEVIKNHRPEEIVPFREPPKYNPRRRTSGIPLPRTHSDPRLEYPSVPRPPSPSPSNRSLPPFSSASSLSEASTGSGSTCTQPSEESCSVIQGISHNKLLEHCDVVSDSSGVGTSGSNSGSGDSYDVQTPTEVPLLIPGTMVVCLEDYHSDVSGHLSISQGDIVEIVAICESGMLEGCLRGEVGRFPQNCVQEVRLRNPEAVRRNIIQSPVGRVQGRRENNRPYYKTTPRIKKLLPCEPRTVVLHKGKKGFGFVLRGAKATSPLMELNPSDRCPAFQYLDDVDPGGVADRAGLKKGDFLLAIGDQDVTQASHEHVVQLIRAAGELVSMTVVTVNPNSGASTSGKPPPHNLARQCATLPRKLSGRSPVAPTPPKRDPKTTLSVGKARAKSLVASLAEMENYSQSDWDGQAESLDLACAGRFTQPTKTATIRPRPGSRRTPVSDQDFSKTLENPSSINGPRVYTSVAEMKRWKASKKHTKGGFDDKIHKIFHSTPELTKQGESKPFFLKLSLHNRRKSHSQEDLHALKMHAKCSRYSWAYSGINLINGKDGLLGRSHESLHDDLPTPVVDSDGRIKSHSTFKGSDEGLKTTLRRTKSANQRFDTSPLEDDHPPPPTHPPPPPPLGQVVKVEVSRSDYASVQSPSPTQSPEGPPSGGVMSSFRPGDNAKLYASPDDMKEVAFKQNGEHSKKDSDKTRSQSLPPGPRSRPQGENRLPSTQSHTSVSTFKCPPVATDSYDPSRTHGYAQPHQGAELCSKDSKGPRLPFPDYSDDEGSPQHSDNTGKFVCKINLSSKFGESEGSKGKKMNRDEEKLNGKEKTGVMSPKHEIFKSQLAQKVAERHARVLDSDHKVTRFGPEPLKVGKTGQAFMENQSLYIPARSKEESPKSEGDPATPSLPHSLSSEEIQEVRGKLKNSRSFPGDLTAEENESVSSESNSPNSHSFVTYISTEGAEDTPDPPKGKSEKPADTDKPARRTGPLTKNAVSLVQLPPPQESGETDAESDTVEHDKSRDSSDSGSTVSSVKSVSVPRPKQPTCAPPPSQTIPSVSKLNNVTHRRMDYPGAPSNGPTEPVRNSGYEYRRHPVDKAHSMRVSDRGRRADVRRRTGDSSDLIRMHVDSLSEVNMLAGLVPPPPGFAEGISENGAQTPEPMAAIAPPPGFSDLDDPELGDGSNFNTPRYKTTIRLSGGRTRVIHSGSFRNNTSPMLPPSIYTDMRHQRGVLKSISTLPKKSCDAQMRGSASVYSAGTGVNKYNTLTLSRGAHQNYGTSAYVSVMKSSLSQKEFRMKPVTEWSAYDTGEWLESLFMPEYKHRFLSEGIDGRKLLSLDNAALIDLGVRRVGHRMNIEKSLRRYLPPRGGM